MDDPADGGTLTSIQREDMEIEKDKGKRPISDSQLGKAGEGTSGTVKEGLAKEGTEEWGNVYPNRRQFPSYKSNRPESEKILAI